MNLDDYIKENNISVDTAIKQVMLEGRGLSTAKSTYTNNLNKLAQSGMFVNTKEGKVLQKLGISQIAEYLEEYLGNTKVRGSNAKYLTFIKENFKDRLEVLSFIVLQEVINAVAVESKSKVVGLSIRLSKAVLDTLSVEEFKKNEPKFYAYLEYEYQSRGMAYINSRKKRLASLRDQAREIETRFMAGLGRILLESVLKSGANLFEVSKQREGRKTIAYVVFTESSEEVFRRIAKKGIEVAIRHKPMLSKPIGWEDIADNGGYYCQNNLSFVRGVKTLEYIEKNEIDLSRLFGIVNKVQETKWVINTYILDVIDNIIENSLVDPRSPIGNPKLYGDIPYMDTLVSEDLIPKERFGEVSENGRFKSKDDYRRWYTEVEEQNKKINSIRSKRIIFFIALSIAKEYKDVEKFYFTYNLDFRGRLYPIQQIFSPQTTGTLKSLLTFANKVRLDEKGYYWLKVNTANQFGLDKTSFKDRVKWVEDNMEEVLACARNPIDTIDIWNKAEVPLQYLASCKAMLDHSVGGLVGLPVSLDATCSGLQLYSGLLLDKVGAEAVNVKDRGSKGIGGKPSDIYTDVALQVEKYLEEGDYPDKFTYTNAEGELKEVSTIVEANDLQGNVTRKLTKRNVMTVPYSVTTRGMYNQVREILDELEDDDKKFWKGEKWVVAKLLIELNKRAISEIIGSATVGQEYIKDVLHDLYSKGYNGSITWKTPIYKFPVIQWARRLRRHRINTVLGNMSLYFPTNNTHKRKMFNGIAPNFIHSMDSTLLYRTVELLMERGVNSYMLIHDSFGVPANSVEDLNEVIRIAFVEIFSQDVLGDWVEQVHKNYTGRSVSDIMVGTLDIQEVKTSTYLLS